MGDKKLVRFKAESDVHGIVRTVPEQSRDAYINQGVRLRRRMQQDTGN